MQCSQGRKNETKEKLGKKMETVEEVEKMVGTDKANNILKTDKFIMESSNARYIEEKN